MNKLEGLRDRNNLKIKEVSPLSVFNDNLSIGYYLLKHTLCF